MKKQCLQQTEHQQSVTIKNNPYLLSHWRDPQLQPDCNPHLGNLKSPPVFFGCWCDTLQRLSTEFRAFIYSSEYTWRFAQFNLFSLSSRLPRMAWAMQHTAFTALFLQLSTASLVSTPGQPFMQYFKCSHFIKKGKLWNVGTIIYHIVSFLRENKKQSQWNMTTVITPKLGSLQISFFLFNSNSYQNRCHFYFTIIFV